MNSVGLEGLRALFFSLILLTQLDGKPIWVESTAVIIVKGQSTDCQHGHGSTISVAGRGLCVRETIDQIREKVEKAK